MTDEFTQEQGTGHPPNSPRQLVVDHEEPRKDEEKADPTALHSHYSSPLTVKYLVASIRLRHSIRVVRPAAPSIPDTATTSCASANSGCGVQCLPLSFLQPRGNEAVRTTHFDKPSHSARPRSAGRAEPISPTAISTTWARRSQLATDWSRDRRPHLVVRGIHAA